MVGGQNYTVTTAFCVIKKTLVYLLMVLDNLRLYVKTKTGVRLKVAALIKPRTSATNELLIKRQIQNQRLTNFHYQLDEALLRLSILELIGKIRIEELLLFVKISQANFGAKNSNGAGKKNTVRVRNVYHKPGRLPRAFCQTVLTGSRLGKNGDQSTEPLRPEQQPSCTPGDWLEIALYKNEIFQVLLAKTKRKDEKLKHSFKAFRKAVRSLYRRRAKSQITQYNQSMFPGHRQLYTELLESDPVLIKAFNMRNVTKRSIKRLKSCQSFVRALESLVFTRLLKDQIIVNVLHKSIKVFTPNMGVETFLRNLMTKQKKMDGLSRTLSTPSRLYSAVENQKVAFQAVPKS